MLTIISTTYPKLIARNAVDLQPFTSAVHNQISTAKFLIERGYGSAIEELDEYGTSPLLMAYFYRNNEFFDFLLDQGVSTRIKRNRA